MSVQIGHAVQDENGQTTGPVSGDQTGKEVRLDKWYAKNSNGIGWEYYLELKSASSREKLARFIEAACANAAIGYSQPNRTELFDSLRGGVSITLAHGDCDCTSLIFMGLIFACGISVPIGYSGNMYRILKETGLFNIYTDTAHLNVDKLAKRGGIYLRKGHALTVLQDGSGAVSSGSADAGGIEPPYVLTLGSVNVRPTPDTKHSPVYTARNDKLPFCGIDSTTGWYSVISPNGPGYITNKKRYTRLVEK